VGSGKSLLMDLFFTTSPGPKRRAHFHEFMVSVSDQCQPALSAIHTVRYDL
jgi:predicted ATPase